MAGCDYTESCFNIVNNNPSSSVHSSSSSSLSNQPVFNKCVIFGVASPIGRPLLNDNENRRICEDVDDNHPTNPDDANHNFNSEDPNNINPIVEAVQHPVERSNIITNSENEARGEQTSNLN